MLIHYVVSKTNNGGWGVKRQGTSQFSIQTDNKNEAIKLGRVLSIKNNGKLVIIDHLNKEQKERCNSSWLWTFKYQRCS